jgi:hypothetical protein
VVSAAVRARDGCQPIRRTDRRRCGAIDLQGTLNALRAIGYRRVEHAGFVGRTVTQFKAALDAAGLRASSGHVLIPQPFNEAAWNASLQDALTLQSRFIVHPFFGINFRDRRSDP